MKDTKVQDLLVFSLHTQTVKKGKPFCLEDLAWGTADHSLQSMKSFLVTKLQHTLHFVFSEAFQHVHMLQISSVTEPGERGRFSRGVLC